MPDFSPLVAAADFSSVIGAIIAGAVAGVGFLLLERGIGHIRHIAVDWDRHFRGQRGSFVSKYRSWRNYRSWRDGL